MADQETMEIEGKTYNVIGHDPTDGLPILQGVATTTEHKDEHGNQIYDEDGNPKISVNVVVPAATLFATPGEVS